MTIARSQVYMIRAADTGFPVDAASPRTRSLNDARCNATQVEARRRAVEKFITRTQYFVKPRALLLLEYAIAGVSFAVAGYLYVTG